MLNVQEEIVLLQREIKRIGKLDPTSNHYAVEFGILFHESANIFEALIGTLRAAKKQKIITFEGEMLFQGKDDKVLITLLKEEEAH